VQKAREEAQIDVTFRSAPDPTPELAPPPPPPPAPKVTGARTRRNAKPVLLQPTEMPSERPEEAAPGGGEAPAVDEEAFGDGGQEAPAPPPPPPPPAPEPEIDLEPVEVAEEVIPAQPLAGNTPPAYPEEARKKGLESTVILKVTITATGEVAEVRVLRGDEPFVAAAVAAVRAWRYRPAVLDGRAVAATRIVKVPFRIRG
jgi:protein TonB